MLVTLSNQVEKVPFIDVETVLMTLIVVTKRHHYLQLPFALLRGNNRASVLFCEGIFFSSEKLRIRAAFCGKITPPCGVLRENIAFGRGCAGNSRIRAVLCGKISPLCGKITHSCGKISHRFGKISQLGGVVQ